MTGDGQITVMTLKILYTKNEPQCETCVNLVEPENIITEALYLLMTSKKQGIDMIARPCRRTASAWHAWLNPSASPYLP